MFYRIILILSCICCVLSAIAQSKGDIPQVFISKTSQEIKVDGILDEGVWSTTPVISDFIRNFPVDSGIAQSKTEVMITYDDRNIYIAAICYDEIEGDYVVQSLKRDFSYPRSDAFAIYLDPLSDQNTGFNFTVNPFGVQREGLLANGGVFGVTTSWDNKWFCEVSQEDDRWIVEMAIPFKTLRYKSDLPTWRINFSRHDLKRNENSSWVGVPRNFNIASLAYAGELVWDQPPPKAGANISLIPYVIGGLSKDYENNEDIEWKYNGGGDAKIAITSSLNLDITINPDFSQVEVDAQITNLDQFELFFPERRQFFIENSDLFAQFGFSRIRPFFSRRIGLARGQQVPILGGFRLSGKVHEDVRIGLLSMQTEGVGTLGVKSENFIVATTEWQAFRRNSFSAIFVNKQEFNKFELAKESYNRVAGIDFNFASLDNHWRGKLFYHQSFSPGNPKDAGANASWISYSDKNWWAMWNHEYVGDNYNAEVGFVPRTGIWRLEPEIAYSFNPVDKKVNRHGPGVYFNAYFNTDWSWQDRLARIYYQLEFENKHTIFVAYNEALTVLQFDFDPSGTGENAPLSAGTEYTYRSAEIDYASDFRRALSGGLYASYGSFFNGNKFTYSAEVNYRAQPWGIFTINFERNEIRLPADEGFDDGFLTLLGAKAELSFTRNVFFTTFVQVNTQIENININSRFQWRFRPMSDLFIVYTDNYGVDPIFARNRAIVIKLNYWFTL